MPLHLVAAQQTQKDKEIAVGKLKRVSDIPAMDDDELGEFWEAHQPEDFEGWKEGG